MDCAQWDGLREQQRGARVPKVIEPKPGKRAELVCGYVSLRAASAVLAAFASISWNRRVTKGP